MRLIVLALLALPALSQETLPQVSSVGAQDVTCIIAVLDNQTSVEMECSVKSVVVSHSYHAPSERGAVLGTGPVFCLLWSKDKTVRLQCSVDYGIGPTLALDGILTPVPRKRTWR